MQHRLEKLRDAMAEQGFDGYVSFDPAANEYLSGFRGSTSAVLVTAAEARFYCDFRYSEQAREQVATFEVEQVEGILESIAAGRAQLLGVQRLAFDSSVLSVRQLELLRNETRAELMRAPTLMAALRMIKDADECARMRAATNLAMGVLDDLLPTLREGTVEREFGAQMEYEFKRRGAQGSSFAPIVLFGSRSSLPHGMPGEKQLEHGDIVLLDFGCIHQSYCSDLTRTFAFGTIPGPWFEEIYQVTLEAQVQALQCIEPGVPCREVDAVARTIISDAGYGDYFGHGLGHGVGLDVHEAPRLNKQSEAVLEAGMAVTVEPGIYLPGKGGVRIEDLVLVTPNGCEVLTQLPKELTVLCPR